MENSETQTSPCVPNPDTVLFTQQGFILTPDYVTGLVDGDGHFGLQLRGGTKVHSAVFKVSALACNRGVLLALVDYFGCGRVGVENRRDNTLKFEVTAKSDLLNKIIPHFLNHPLQGSKALDYND